MANVKELQSIVDYETFGPSVDPVFDTGCAPACTLITQVGVRNGVPTLQHGEDPAKPGFA